MLAVCPVEDTEPVVSAVVLPVANIALAVPEARSVVDTGFAVPAALPVADTEPAASVECLVGTEQTVSVAFPVVYTAPADLPAVHMALVEFGASPAEKIVVESVEVHSGAYTELVELDKCSDPRNDLVVDSSLPVEACNSVEVVFDSSLAATVAETGSSNALTKEFVPEIVLADKSEAVSVGNYLVVVGDK